MDDVEKILEIYEARSEKKEELLERGLTNALAEHSLDRLGYPRPAGWHSVFFYPGSSRPRNKFILLLFVVGILIVIFS